MSTLTDIEGVVSSVAGSLTTVGTIATAVGKVADLFAPVVTEEEVQNYENAFKSRNAKISSVLSMPDSLDRANALRDLLNSLCSGAGTPTGCFGENISTPISFLAALLTIASGKIRDDEYLAGFEQLTGKSGPVATPPVK